MKKQILFLVMVLLSIMASANGYCPFMAVTSIDPKDISVTVTFDVANAGAEGVAPATKKVEVGTKVTIPVNTTLFIEGKTLTAWTDGTNQYTCGQEVTVSNDMTLYPVFTDNTVSLNQRTAETTVVWQFGEANGVGTLKAEHKKTILVTQATIGEAVIDVKMDIDAIKINNVGLGKWAQCNDGTILTIPAARGMQVTLDTYNTAEGTTTTIGGKAVRAKTTTYYGSDATIDIVAQGIYYIASVTAVYPIYGQQENVFRNFAVQLTNADIFDTDVTKFGVKVYEDNTYTAVANNDAMANFTVDAERFFDSQHGWENCTFTIPVDGPVKVGLGNCSYGNQDGTITDAEGNVIPLNTENKNCWNAYNIEETTSYTIYRGTAATTLTVKYNGYCPFISVEAIDPADLQGTTEVITLTKEGQLQLTLLDLETDYISCLTIKGPVNGKDIQYLRSGIGKLSKLEELNLSDVELVADEEPYCVITSPVEGTFHHTQYTYYISDKNSTEYLGVSSISMAATILYKCLSNRLDQFFNESEIGKTLKKVTMPRNFTSIGEEAFKRTSVETVVMESPIKEIGAAAFYSSQIKKVESDWSQLDNIGSSAFAYANSFAGNKENNTLDISRLDSIPYNAFIGCNIKKVVLSPRLLYIGDGALYCDALKEANVPSTLEHLWYGSFSSNSPFFKDLPEEDHIAYLGKFALCVKERLSSPTTLKFKEGTEYIVDKFYIDDNFNYKYIEGLEFPSTLKRIGESAFTGYGGHIKSIAFPEGLEEIGENAFYKLDNLEKVSFPSTLKKIGRSAFEGCGLLKVVIPEAITEIERYAFRQCNSLQRVEFYAKHVYDGDGWHNGIFVSCPSLEKVTIGSKVEVIPESMCSGCSQLIIVDFLERDAFAGKLQINKYAFENCKMEEIVLPEGLDSIGWGTFSRCNYLSSLVLPNSLVSIKGDAFYYCTKLKAVAIPNNVTYLDPRSFAGCTTLESLTINSDESFEWQRQGLSALKEVTFGNNVKTINERAFYNMETIEKVNFSEGLETIGASAFSCCYALTTLSFPTSLKSIGGGAFSYCSNLHTITLQEGLDSIENFAFVECSSLTSVTIPNSVTSIGGSAFKFCTGLSSVCISDLEAWCKIVFVNELSNPLCYANHLFLHGEEVKDLVIPNSMTSIGNFTFYNCDGLTSVTIPNSVSTIGESAFYSCDDLTSITIPNSVTRIEANAFSYCRDLMDVICYADKVPSTYSNAFDVSNTNYATLHVPQASISAYKSKTPWNRFLSIVKIDMPEHTLTYMVDGEVYKTYSIEEGATITPEPAPTKEGYTFSGWSELPETMPAHDVTVTGSFTKIELGDANSDGVVDVADVVAIVNYILNKPGENFNEKAADANNDGVIDVADVVAVVNIILKGGNANSPEAKAHARAYLKAHGFIVP